MRRKSFLTATVLLVVLVAVPASGHGRRQYVATCLRSNPPVCGPGRLEVDLKAAVTPRGLPRRGFAPAAVTVGGAVRTEGGGHPSALREATVAVDEGIRVDTEGLAICGWRQLESLDVTSARRACRSAIVGRGVAHVGLASSGKVLRAPLALYNGGTSDGVTRLFIHSAAEAVGSPLVAVAQVRRRRKGLEVALKLPPILEGDGSLLSFRLQIGRRFARDGERHSYLSASCARGVLKVRVPELVFRNETRAPGVPAQTSLKGALAVPCPPG